MSAKKPAWDRFRQRLKKQSANRVVGKRGQHSPLAEFLQQKAGGRWLVIAPWFWNESHGVETEQPLPPWAEEFDLRALDSGEENTGVRVRTCIQLDDSRVMRKVPT